MHRFARNIVETVPFPLLILDDGLRVIGANVPFYRTFGGTPATVEGRDFFQIDGCRWDKPKLRALIEDVIAKNGRSADLEVEQDCRQLGRRTMILRAFRSTGDDSMALVLLAIEDDTERRQVRNELRRLNAELESRVIDRTVELEATNRELEAFCYSVSHDLRAPLRAVDGFSQELLNEYSDRLDEQGRHYLTRIRAGTQRMGQLIDDLLNLSRVTRAEMRWEHVDLSALAEVVLSELREQTPGRPVSFTARPGMIAYCDPQLIRVVVENLLRNAWKFTGKNPEAAITFDQIMVANKPTFLVKDNGAGFDMQYVGKLFGAFQRLHSDREFSGTGVGLATVMRIVRRHGGNVWAEGAVGRGATFYFTLPKTEVSE